MPSFAPRPRRHSPSYPATLASSPEGKRLEAEMPNVFRRYQSRELSRHDFVKEYRALPIEQREALKAEQRRRWWNESQKRLQAKIDAANQPASQFEE